MDPQVMQTLTTVLQAIAETNRALAWHAQVQTYLLLGVTIFASLTLWDIVRISREIHHMTREVLTRLPPQP